MKLTPADLRASAALLACASALACAEPCDDAAQCGDTPRVEARASRDDGPLAQQVIADDASVPRAPDASAAGTGVTFTVEGTKRAKLVVEGARCSDNRCVLPAVPAGGTQRVDLTLSNAGTADMPVWVRWRGCTNYDGQLWPIWQSNPPSYETLYTHVFQGLTAGSECVAEVVQGSWYVFAGNLSVKATVNAQYCREQYSSRDNLNLQCFIPAREKIAITSNLRSWQCFTDGKTRATAPVTHRQTNLSFTSAGNEVTSCMGSAL